MNIEPATIADADQIAAVHIRSWQAAYAGILEPEFLASLSIEERAERWRVILKKNESQTLVARQEPGVTGFVSYGPCRDDGAADDEGEIWALYAQPEVWGQGVGRALLSAALRELRSAGRTTVSLWVLRQNDRGIRFYRAFGFAPVHGNVKEFELGGTMVEEISLRLRNGAEREAIQIAPGPNLT